MESAMCAALFHLSDGRRRTSRAMASRTARHGPVARATREPAARLARWLGMVMAGLMAPALFSACGGPTGAAPMSLRSDLESASLQTLTAALTDANPVVQVRAIEAMQQVAPQRAMATIHELLFSKIAPVRFAALMAVGALKHAGSRQRVASLLTDPDAHVQVAALFALHRLGDTSRSGQLASMLRTHANPAVRANAALAFGRLGDPRAVQPLQQALRDKDESVQLQAMESLVLLGDKKAVGRLGFIAMSSTGQKMVFALLALRSSRRAEARDVFMEKFLNDRYDEVRLAAAAGLGRCGDARGLPFAIERLQRFSPRSSDVDPPAVQAARVKTLAALAIGECGKTSALPALEQALKSETDLSVRVAVARAALAILHRDPLAPAGS